MSGGGHDRTAMTDRDGANTPHDQDADQTDPLLVRPWIAGGPSGSTWPSPATRPGRHAAARHALPAPFTPPDPASPISLPRPAPATAPAAAGRSRRRLLVAAGAGLAAVVAAAAAGYAAFRPHDEPVPPAPDALPPLPAASSPSASHPPLPRVTPPAGGPGRSPLRAATASHVPASRPAPAGGFVRSASPGAATSTSASTGDAVPGAAFAPRTSAVSPPPAADRSGAIGADGSRCLDLNGGVPVDDNHVQVFDCNGTQAQRWTLASDGTLRVVGKCAQVVDDRTVHIIGCDTRTSAQWRAAAGNALLNVATGDCLTDPAAGARNGAGVVVEACAATANQRWTLP
jgi:hypothetical protein